MKKFLGLIFIVLLLSSCGEYQSFESIELIMLIYKKAVEYYNKGEYQKAMNLFDGIRSVFTGTSKAQSIAYYRAFCSYNQKEYEYASELFKNLS